MSLREGVKNAPFMSYLNDTGTFIIVTTGYILYQTTPSGGDGIVSCGGQSLRGAELNYTITELEMLSVVEAVNKYRYFLLGRQFIIKSDHLSLRFINSIKDSSMGSLHLWSL